STRTAAVSPTPTRACTGSFRSSRRLGSCAASAAPDRCPTAGSHWSTGWGACSRRRGRWCSRKSVEGDALSTSTGLTRSARVLRQPVREALKAERSGRQFRRESRCDAPRGGFRSRAETEDLVGLETFRNSFDHHAAERSRIDLALGQLERLPAGEDGA